MLKIISLTVLALSLSACQTFNAQNYGVSIDNNFAIKSMKLTESVSIGDFSIAKPLETTCRAVGPISLPNNLTFQAYLKKAFEDELKIAGAYAHKSPKVVLSGRINRLDMSSSKAITRGYWDIDLTVTSSNGKSLTVSEYYEFASGFEGHVACQNTANALMPAVQNLISKVIKSPNFSELVAVK